MSSIIIFFIIALVIKNGMTQGRGFRGISDIGKIILGLGLITVVASIIISMITSIFTSLLASPGFWILLFLAAIALVIIGAQKKAEKERAEKYGWNTEEYQAKYAECLAKFKRAYMDSARDRDGYQGMNRTEQMAANLDVEKRARESAKEETDAYMRSKYGDPVERAKADTMAKKAEKKSPVSKADIKAKENERKAKAQQLKSKVLPKSSARRVKIIAAFSEKYDLYLTDEQIKRIADASYMSAAWKQEVEDMSQKYDAVYGWMIGDTAYLRAYLRAFTVQDVTSDFKQQMQIVMDSFEEVFDYSDSISTLSIDQRIEKINSKFMTNFDEITYMIAYRYLETLGLHHQLDRTQINRVDNTFDDLVAKYENMSADEIDRELDSVTGSSQTN